MYKPLQKSRRVRQEVDPVPASTFPNLPPSQPHIIAQCFHVFFGLDEQISKGDALAVEPVADVTDVNSFACFVDANETTALQKPAEVAVRTEATELLAFTPNCSLRLLQA